jgi:phage terminase small subunit
VAGNQTETPAADAAAVAPVLEVQIPQPPGSLTLEELAEWHDLAPRAARVGTLNDDTLFALRDLCQARVLKDKLLRQVVDQGTVVSGAGGNLAAHPLLARFTTLLQRVEAGMLRFKLSPMGKEIEAPKEADRDAFAEFDQTAPAVTGSGETVN